MALHASDKGSGGNFQPAPSGNHIARCVSIIDLGTQEGEYMGKPIARHQVFIMFELCDKMKTYTNKDDQEVTEPFTVSGFYTLSLNEKANLCQLLEGWRGRAFTEEEKEAFDIMVLLGLGCMINVVHYQKKNGDTGARIASVSQLPSGMEAPEPVHKLTEFSLEDFNQEVFHNLSDGLRKIIEQSFEFKVISGQVGQRDTDPNQGRTQEPPQQTAPTDAVQRMNENPAPLGGDEFDDIPF